MIPQSLELTPEFPAFPGDEDDITFLPPFDLSPIPPYRPATPNPSMEGYITSSGSSTPHTCGKKPAVTSPLQKKVKDWGNWVQVVMDAEPFDLIEINRHNGLYQHWVMYLGKGNIVHVTQVQGRTQGGFAEKRVDKLRTIARKDGCRINNHSTLANERGLETSTKDDVLLHIQDVVTLVGPFYEARATNNGIDKNQTAVEIVPYSVSKYNCEYYVTMWKYGEGFSHQIEIAKERGIEVENLHASMELVQDLDQEEREAVTSFIQNYKEGTVI